MTADYGVVKGYSEELVRVASYPPFLTLTVKSRLGIYRDRHERAMPNSKAAWDNIIASCCHIALEFPRRTLLGSSLNKRCYW